MVSFRVNNLSEMGILVRVRRYPIFLSLILTIFIGQFTSASAGSFEALAEIDGLTKSKLDFNSALKVGGTAKLRWEFSQQSGESLKLLEGLKVFDKYSQRNYDLKRVETAWVTRTINIACYSSENSSVGKTFSKIRVNFLIPFSPITSNHILSTWVIDENVTDFEIPIHAKCSDMRVFSTMELNLQAIVGLNGGEVSKHIWLNAVTKDYSTFANVKGAPVTAKKTASATSVKKTPAAAAKKPNPAAKPSASTKSNSKKASCSIFNGEKIYATYGMAEAPFGVTTIKFENITDCRLDVSIRGDFIGISNNQQMRCSVNGMWSLDPYSRIELAPAGTVSGAIPFQSVFPQLVNCFRTINAQKNFTAIITGASES